MHVLVATCAHRGDDARIVHRQARSLLEAGHRVTLIAPAPPDRSCDPGGLERVDIARAAGRRRLRSWREALRAIRRRAATADLLLVHDPELVPLAVSARIGIPIVWDVHEDFVASVDHRRYIPNVVRRPVIAIVRWVQRLGRRRCHVILAEDSYIEDLGNAPVVPNTAWVPAEPPPRRLAEPARVVYVGRLSTGRGVHEMIEVGRRLAGRAELVLVGPADADVEAAVRSADEHEWLRWAGPLANPLALREVDGALCGLALLHDEPNYVHSRPTKVVEYLARGVPVISTPLPLAAEVVRSSGAGSVVPFGDVEAVVAAVDRLRCDQAADSARRQGHAYVAANHNWHVDGARFVELLERWALEAEDARKRREQAFHDRRFGDDPRTTTKGYYEIDRGKDEYRRTAMVQVQTGDRVLEYGCGTGSLAVNLAKRGAAVTGIDLSSVAVAMADESARARFGGSRAADKPNFVQMDAERLAFADNSFDLVCGSAILHHLDLDAALAEISRVLAPGGRAVFLEPLGHNPLINGYRRATPSLRTDDEHPLLSGDLVAARRYFSSTATEHYDLFALIGTPLRRWSAGQSMIRALHRLDAFLFTRSALARRWSWMVLITLSEPLDA